MENTTSLLTSQIAAAAACSYLLNLLQKWSKTPWITEHTAGINAAVRAVLALGATVGIGWAWSSGANDTHVLMVTIPSFPVLIHGLWHWFSQYAIQHGFGKVLDIGQPTQVQLPIISQPPGTPAIVPPTKEQQQ